MLGYLVMTTRPRCVKGYTETELELAIRQEKAALIKERPPLARRLAEIDRRLLELEKAEHLLENGFQ